MKKFVCGLMALVAIGLAIFGYDYYLNVQAEARHDAAYDVALECDPHYIDIGETVSIAYGSYRGCYDIEQKVIEIPGYYLYKIVVCCTVPGHEEVIWHREGWINRDDREKMHEFNNDCDNVLLQMKDTVEKNGWA